MKPPWTLACQALLSMEFFRQEKWSGLPFPSPGDLPDPGSRLMPPVSPALQDSLSTEQAFSKYLCPDQHNIGLARLFWWLSVPIFFAFTIFSHSCYSIWKLITTAILEVTWGKKKFKIFFIILAYDFLQKQQFCYETAEALCNDLQWKVIISIKGWAA